METFAWNVFLSNQIQLKSSTEYNNSIAVCYVLMHNEMSTVKRHVSARFESEVQFWRDIQHCNRPYNIYLKAEYGHISQTISHDKQLTTYQ